MSKPTLKQDWLLLVHLLPPKPTNLRVRTWRKLQKLGAVPVKNSVYALPFNDKTHEDFQWLKQEIESAGGEATIFRAGAIEGATDRQIIAVFRKARDEEYSAAAADLEKLEQTIRVQKRGGQVSARLIARSESELDRLHKELARIQSIDFFEAQGRATTKAAYERCHKMLRALQKRAGPRADSILSNSPGLDLAQYQGRRWVTRRNLFIDRLAAIWLIKRFIDKRPRFSFVSDGEEVEGAIRFDMYGAELTHEGEDCTFETMIKRFGLSNDAALCALAEIVHDIDLKDDKFNRSEAAGLSAVIRGLSELLKDDRKLANQCAPIFDGLYELLKSGGEKASKKIEKRSVPSRTGKHRVRSKRN
jgi:hypothetical protein